MKKINIKAETFVGIGLAALTVAQLVLGNKKEAIENNKMKDEIIKEVMDKISEVKES